MIVQAALAIQYAREKLPSRWPSMCHPQRLAARPSARQVLGLATEDRPGSDLRESRGFRGSLALPLHRHHNLADLFVRLHVSMGLDNLIKLEGLRDDGFKDTGG